jgi:hypothetical protein
LWGFIGALGARLRSTVAQMPRNDTWARGVRQEHAVAIRGFHSCGLARTRGDRATRNAASIGGSCCGDR